MMSIRTTLVALSVAILSTTLAAAAPADGGTITGTVDARPAKYLKETFVFIKKIDGVKARRETTTIDQKGMTFVPHMITVTAGDTVKFLNHDNVEHNIMSPEGPYDLGKWGQGKETSYTFKQPGVFTQLCKIHPEMIAYVFVGQNPYAAIVDDKGAFTITGVPAGTYELDVWNPKLKAAGQKITLAVGGNATVKFSLAR
jgi:plastocyanin